MSYQLISFSSSSRDIWSQFPCTVSLLNIFFSFLIYQTHSYFNSHSTSFHQSWSEKSVCFHIEDTRSSMGSIVRRVVIHLRKRSPSFGPQPSGYPNICPLTPGRLRGPMTFRFSLSSSLLKWVAWSWFLSAYLSHKVFTKCSAASSLQFNSFGLRTLAFCPLGCGLGAYPYPGPAQAQYLCAWDTPDT